LLLCVFLAGFRDGRTGIARCLRPESNLGARLISPLRRASPMTSAQNPGGPCPHVEIYYI
jgi:hypothetical protein